MIGTPLAQREEYSGPALFSYGFRPFFLAAILSGAGVIPVWLMVWTSRIDLSGPFDPVDWHVHEMIFGYAAAVIAGFLFTAVPNWTGRMPTRGWPLMALSALWLLGRLAVGGQLSTGPVGTALIDCAFLFALACIMGVEIVAGRNWRNLKVVVPVALLFTANLVFHIEAAFNGTASIGRRLGFAVVIFLITLIGGRIIPSFTRNWLASRKAKALPAPFQRFDGVTVVASALALLVWSILPEHPISASLLLPAGILHGIRLARWRGLAVWKNPLLVMLHIAYLFLPFGLVDVGLSALGLLPAAVGVHLLGIGAIGGMTIAVMMRATLGHTGRELVAGPMLSAAFCLIAGAALVRSLVPFGSFGPIDGITVAALLWTVGYGLLVLRLASCLVQPRADRKRPSKVV
jgi:uncharacterized protein involved in response to NO